jgi:hypothetical protein
VSVVAGPCLYARYGVTVVMLGSWEGIVDLHFS